MAYSLASERSSPAYTPSPASTAATTPSLFSAAARARFNDFVHRKPRAGPSAARVAALARGALKRYRGAGARIASAYAAMLAWGRGIGPPAVAGLCDELEQLLVGVFEPDIVAAAAMEQVLRATAALGDLEARRDAAARQLARAQAELADLRLAPETRVEAVQGVELWESRLHEAHARAVAEFQRSATTVPFEVLREVLTLVAERDHARDTRLAAAAAAVTQFDAGASGRGIHAG